MSMALREIDRLYFGPRVGKGSAIHAFAWLITGKMPLAFVARYWRGEI